jgi:hypothetical protein
VRDEDAIEIRCGNSIPGYCRAIRVFQSSRVFFAQNLRLVLNLNRISQALRRLSAM